MSKNVNSFEEYNELNEGLYDDARSIDDLMEKFNLDLQAATELYDIIEEMLNMDDIDDRMDYVDSVFLYSITEDEDVVEEILEYLKDICIN